MSQWILHDPEAVATYVFEINPATVEQDPKSKGISYERTDNGLPIIFETTQDARYISWRGYLFSEADLALFQGWYDVGNTVDLTDDLGQQFEVFISSYSATRVKSATNPWFHQYEMRAVILTGP